jgi:hypothetical protein
MGPKSVKAQVLYLDWERITDASRAQFLIDTGTAQYPARIKVAWSAGFYTRVAVVDLPEPTVEPDVFYRWFNRGSGDEHPLLDQNHLRSLSIGDLIRVGKNFWLCRSVGWEEIALDTDVPVEVQPGVFFRKSQINRDLFTLDDETWDSLGPEDVKQLYEEMTTFNRELFPTEEQLVGFPHYRMENGSEVWIIDQFGMLGEQMGKGGTPVHFLATRKADGQIGYFSAAPEFVTQLMTKGTKLP